MLASYFTSLTVTLRNKLFHVGGEENQGSVGWNNSRKVLDKTAEARTRPKTSSFPRSMERLAGVWTKRVSAPAVQSLEDAWLQIDKEEEVERSVGEEKT